MNDKPAIDDKLLDNYFRHVMPQLVTARPTREGMLAAVRVHTDDDDDTIIGDFTELLLPDEWLARDDADAAGRAAVAAFHAIRFARHFDTLCASCGIDPEDDIHAWMLTGLTHRRGVAFIVIADTHGGIRGGYNDGGHDIDVGEHDDMFKQVAATLRVLCLATNARSQLRDALADTGGAA